MRRSLFPSDDSLPTWLHTFACFFVVSWFGVPLLWWGAEAIHTRYLPPLSGPELGQYFLVPRCLRRLLFCSGRSLYPRGANHAASSLRSLGAHRGFRTARYTWRQSCLAARHLTRRIWTLLASGERQFIARCRGSCIRIFGLPVGLHVPWPICSSRSSCQALQRSRRPDLLSAFPTDGRTRYNRRVVFTTTTRKGLPS